MVITMKIDGRLVLVGAIYLFLAISAALIAFPGVAIWLPRNSSEMASWVQAIGSIGAIVAGAIYLSWEMRDGEKSRAHEALAKDVRDLQLIATGVFQCIIALKSAQLVSNTNDEFNRTVAGFDAFASTLQAVPLLQIPDVWVATTVSRATHERERLRIRLARNLNNEPEQLHKTHAVDISLREFLEAERVLGKALEDRQAKMPYSRVELGDGTVLHEYLSCTSK